MKKPLALLLISLFLVLATSCTEQKNENQSSKSTDPVFQMNQDMKDWLKTAKLTAVEDPEEIYHKALKEDTLIVYSNSTRIMDVKKSFEQQYPGLTVYIEDVRSVDLIDTLAANFEKKDYRCDIVFCDDDGILSQKFLPQGIVFKYVPHDIAQKLLPGKNQDILPVVIELQQAFYNSEVYNAPPIHNWWELTEEKYKNKVVMPSPLKSISSMGFYSMILKNSDIMEQSYFNLYGKHLSLQSGETAGEAYWRMMFENGLILVNSSDEVFDMVGTPGQTDPPIGIMISSKIRMRELGYEIQPIFGMDDFSGVYSSNGIMIAGGSKNINSAKLFIRWILGESDGQGEGYKPYLQNGAWSVRSDVNSRSEQKLDEINWLDLDVKYMYENHRAEEKLLNQYISGSEHRSKE